MRISVVCAFAELAELPERDLCLFEQESMARSPFSAFYLVPVWHLIQCFQLLFCHSLATSLHKSGVFQIRQAQNGVILNFTSGDLGCMKEVHICRS